MSYESSRPSSTGLDQLTSRRIITVRRSMRRAFLMTIGTVVFVAALYELAFRYCTAASGEVDMKAQPPGVYYSSDLPSSFQWRKAVFGFRTRLAFGKVRLASGAYVDGGKFYRRLSDGSWQDVTSALRQYQSAKNTGNGEQAAPANRSQPVRPATNQPATAAGSGR